ncbi:MAG: EamA family transporter [Vulcanimicrobiaceae bacterium]
MLSIVLGICAAAFYGGADFCGGLATRRTAMLSVTAISQAAGLVLLVAMLPLFPAHAHLADYLWGALAGICGGVGIALLYHALSIGTMGVVSPITAVLAASVPVAFGALRGDRLGIGQIVGIAVALVAVVLISSSTEADGTRELSTRGVKEAVASGLILGGFYLFLAHARPSMGLDPLVGARISSVLFLLLLAGVTKTDLRPRGGTLPLIVLCGLIDMTANALYLLATYNGQLAIAAVLTSLYPASTVLLARLVLKERLRLVQKMGVGLALIGVALIAS